MSNKTLEDQWRSFSELVIPPGASLMQHRDMRRCFYGGAKAMFDLFYQIAQPGQEDPTPEEMAAVSRVEVELIQFIEDFEAGKA